MIGLIDVEPPLRYHPSMEIVSDDRRRLRIALGITLLFMVTEIIAGFMSGSLALLADAGHMLTDGGALALSLLVLWLSEKPPTPRRTFGFRRTEILAALANGLVLWATVGIIGHEAFQRLRHPEPIVVGPMLIVAVFGLIANMVNAWILHESHHENLNMKGAYLHVITDSIGSAGVIVASIIVAKTGYVRADPLVSLFICALILFSSWGLIKESLSILLEATPPHLNVAEIERALRSISGVSDLHDIHVWTVTSGFVSFSGHLVVPPDEKSQVVLKEAQKVLQTEFGIEHSTIQIEKHEPSRQRISFPSQSN